LSFRSCHHFWSPGGTNPTATPSGGFDGVFDTLVWSDEFAGPNINLNNWTYDIGGGGWGNNEYEYYTDRPENSRIENGMLVIEARAERMRGRNYTSARLKTQGLQTFTYGRIEARIQVPYGQGIWPAFWMLGSDITTVGWPNSGEIDIMEHIGREPYNVYGTVHGPNYSGANGVGNFITLSQPVTNSFHEFAIEWTPTEIRWYLDNVQYHSVTPNTVPGAWVFNHDFFLILNVAVGGYWPGYPDATTVFPQRMTVDYVRVYQ
jgi:beta-glucanase (GH16 family)